MSRKTEYWLTVIILFCALCLSAIFGVDMRSAQQANLQLAVENQKLREINQVVTHSQNWDKRGGVDWQAVYQASAFWHVDPHLLAAVRMTENGNPGLDCGAHGFPDPLLKNQVPVEAWNYWAAASAINKVALQFCNAPENRNDWLLFLAERYTGKPRYLAVNWKRNVQALERVKSR